MAIQEVPVGPFGAHRRGIPRKRPQPSRAPREGLGELESDLQLSPEEFALSALEAIRRLRPLERRRFARLLREQARQQDLRIPELLTREPLDEELEHPSVLAHLVADLHSSHPSFLPPILGSSGFGGLRKRLVSLPAAQTRFGHPAAWALAVTFGALVLPRLLRRPASRPLPRSWIIHAVHFLRLG